MLTTIRSLVSRVLTALDATTDGEGPEVYPQRIASRTGAWQVQVNQEPDGGALAGSFVLQGKLKPEAGWSTVEELALTSFSGAAEYPFGIVLAGVSILPIMRVALVGAADVAASTVADSWIME